MWCQKHTVISRSVGPPTCSNLCHPVFPLFLNYLCILPPPLLLFIPIATANSFFVSNSQPCFVLTTLFVSPFLMIHTQFLL